jgi:hypothetical protein
VACARIGEEGNVIDPKRARLLLLLLVLALALAALGAGWAWDGPGDSVYLGVP